MTALPEGWIPLSDEELERLDQIDRNNQVTRHKYLEDRIKTEFRNEGAMDVLTIRSDICAINGHQWVPEHRHTRRCSTCFLWEALF